MPGPAGGTILAYGRFLGSSNTGEGHMEESAPLVDLAVACSSSFLRAGSEPRPVEVGVERQVER